MGRAGCGGECSADKREVRELAPVELAFASVEAESGKFSYKWFCRLTVDGGSVEHDAGPRWNGVVAQSGRSDDDELLVELSCRIDESSQALSAAHPANCAVMPSSCCLTRSANNRGLLLVVCVLF